MLVLSGVVELRSIDFCTGELIYVLRSVVMIAVNCFEPNPYIRE